VFGSKGRLEKRLEAEGRPASARVVAIKKLISSAVEDGHYSVFQHLKLQVEPEGEPPFEAVINVRSSRKGEDEHGNRGPLTPLREIAPQFTVGKIPWIDLTGEPEERIPVLFDPDDHDKVVLDMRPESEAQRLGFRASAPTPQRHVDHDTATALHQQEIADASPQERLETLKKLHDSGLLDDDEYELRRGKILDAI
jgi:Short C-terminal domain